MVWNQKVRDLTPEQLQRTESRARDPRQNGGNVFLGRKEALLDVAKFDFDTWRALDMNPADFYKKVRELVWHCETNGATAPYGCAQRYGYTGHRIVDIGELSMTEVEHRTHMAFCPFGPPVTEVSFSATEGKLNYKFGEDDIKACEGIGDNGWGDSNIYIENRKLGKSTFLGDLLVHLMEAHDFCEGQGTRYRFDPLYNLYVLGMINEEAYRANIARLRLYDPELA